MDRWQPARRASAAEISDGLSRLSGRTADGGRRTSGLSADLVLTFSEFPADCKLGLLFARGTKSAPCEADGLWQVEGNHPTKEMACRGRLEGLIISLVAQIVKEVARKRDGSSAPLAGPYAKDLAPADGRVARVKWLAGHPRDFGWAVAPQAFAEFKTLVKRWSTAPTPTHSHTHNHHRTHTPLPTPPPVHP